MVASVIALALVTSLLGGSVALAGAATTSTTFRMNDEGGFVEYKGRVDSPSARCIKNRVIEIFHNGVKIGETRTDEDGRWSVDGPVPPDGDDVTVKVKPKKRRGKTICKGTSRTKAFEADD